MPATDFSFDIRLDTGLDDSLALLEELAAAVLHHAGCSPSAASALNGRLHEAVEQGRPGACDVQFRADADGLSVVLTDPSGKAWRGSYPVVRPSDPG